MYEHHFSALQLSLLVASSATILNVIPAIISALIITKTKLPGKIILDIIISLPLAIPPVAIGFFLLQILGNKSPLSDFLKITLGIDIIFTWQAAAIAAAITSFPLMVRTIIVSMNSIEEKLESCARTLGANKIKVMLTITVPLAYKGILGGILIGFGTRYAGGCTSGHAISGLSNLQLPSLIAVAGFFFGGLVMTYFLLPVILSNWFLI